MQQEINRLKFVCDTVEVQRNNALNDVARLNAEVLMRDQQIGRLTQENKSLTEQLAAMAPPLE